jgi:hypothetical protein
MRSDSPRHQRKIINIVAIGLIVLAALAVRPIKIFYHDSAMRRAWTKTFQDGGTNSLQIPVFERHRDALVGLGYMVKQTFRVENIKARSPEHRALYDALNENAAKVGGYFSMQGFETNTPLVVIVWATPAQMPQWDALLIAHQQPKKSATL